MREFYFKDKKRDVAYRGIMPNNDVDCPPFDYFRFLYAEINAKRFAEMLEMKCPVPIPEQTVRAYVLEKIDELLDEKLSNSSPKPEIQELLEDDALSYKQQIRLIKDLTLSGIDILWLNRQAQDMGYLLDVYHEEKYPVKFDQKKHPCVLNQTDDGTMETLGETDMTEGEMRAFLEQRKVVQARIYHRNNHWHCFYFTFKGLAGEESGMMGSKPHYHYLSDKSGLAWDDLLQRIKDCDLPSSKLHIVIV